MATDTVFVDGTLASGANNGTSWENAYQGVAGLQTAIDAVTNTNTTNMYIRNTFTLSGANIDIDGTSGGTASTNSWLSIIGCHPTADTGTDATPLTLGNYVQIDANGSLGAAVVLIDDVGNVAFKNIHILDNGDSDGIMIDNGSVDENYLLENVKCTGHSNYAINMATANEYGVTVLNCVFDDCDGAYLVYDKSLGGSYYRNTVFKATASQALLYNAYAVHCTDCVFIGGDKGIYTVTFMTIVTNCTFYNQSAACIDNDGYTLIATNNIFMPTVAASDYGILLTGGSVAFCDYNNTWAIDGAACQMSTGTTGSNDISVNPAFTGAGSDNFEVGSWQVMESGLLDTGSKPSHIGAVGKPSAYDVIVGELL